MKLLSLLLLLAAIVGLFFLGRASRQWSRVGEEAREPVGSRRDGKPVDMRACEVCGTFRPVSEHRPCERADCPLR